MSDGIKLKRGSEIITVKPMHVDAWLLLGWELYTETLINTLEVSTHGRTSNHIRG